MNAKAPLFALSYSLVVAVACSSASDPAPPAAAPPPEAAAGCNPVVADDCLTPFPSAFFERADSASATGYRVALPATGALPVQASGTALSVERMNRKDGFSPATPFVVYFAAGVDKSQLFGWRDPSPSLLPASPVQVIDYETGERVLAFAELDANVTRDGQRQGLLIHPLVRLKAGKRYIVALVGLRDAAGLPLAPAPFRALRDRTTLSKSLQPLASRYEEIFAALGKAGVDRSKLSLAWDVVTASDKTATGNLVKMRDDAFAALEKGELGYSIVAVTPGTGPHTLSVIDATVKVPSYLADDSGKSTMKLDADGNPVMRAIVDVPVTITIPKCAQMATAPLPAVVFGHGLFGNAKSTITGGPAQAAADGLCTIFVATDWIGLSSSDVQVLPDLLTADLNNFYVITDRLQQAQLNALVMTRTFLTKIKDDPALAVGGKPITDGKAAYYFGVSNGGIQGTTVMGLTPDVVRGVLNVPGSEWSLMIYRSADLGQFGRVLGILLPDPLDRQIAIAYTQSEWDHTDPASYAPHLLSDPLPGVPVKRILVQESIGDAQVANVSTRVLARTMGLTGFDLSEPVPGLATGAAPLDSAYTQWNSHKTPLPPDDDTSLPKDNGAHDSVWASPKALDQISAFCRPDGQVTSVCGGPCNLP